MFPFSYCYYRVVIVADVVTVVTKYYGCWASSGGNTLISVEGHRDPDLAEGGAVGAEQGLSPGKGQARTRRKGGHAQGLLPQQWSLSPGTGTA